MSSVYKPSLHTRNNPSTGTTRITSTPLDDPPMRTALPLATEKSVMVVESHGHSEEYPNNIADGRYRLLRKIGEGSFGVIFLALDRQRVEDKKSRVAVKFEHRKCSAPQLRDEYRTYMLLRGCSGIPSVHYYGQEGDFYCLVMDLLGDSLEELFETCGRRFTVQTVAQLGVQMISLIRSIHERGLIYRDIKPDNFLVGLEGDSDHLYLIDFGMAKYFRDPKSGVHIPYRERKSLSGTARYMSINTHLGREQSRRDDLESIGHVLFYFLRGSLPWQGLKAATNKEKYEKIGAKKQATPIKELVEGYPWEFARYLEYCRSLPFEADPDYNFVLNLMRGLCSSPRTPPDWVGRSGTDKLVQLQHHQSNAHREHHNNHHHHHDMSTRDIVSGAMASSRPSPALKTAIMESPVVLETPKPRSPSLWRRLLCMG